MGTVRWNLPPGGLAAAAREAAKLGHTRATAHVQGVAVDQTPISEGGGDLRRSAATDVGDMEANVTFDTPYAIYVHEILTNRHPRGGNAKFLERASQAEAGTVGQIMAQAAKEVLGGG